MDKLWLITKVTFLGNPDVPNPDKKEIFGVYKGSQEEAERFASECSGGFEANTIGSTKYWGDLYKVYYTIKKVTALN